MIAASRSFVCPGLPSSSARDASPTMLLDHTLSFAGMLPTYAYAFAWDRCGSANARLT